MHTVVGTLHELNRYLYSIPVRSVSKMYGSLCDIGLNLLDEMFLGVYNGKKKHDSDMDDVLDRAFNIGVTKCIVTTGFIEESRQAFELLNSINHRMSLTMTVGVHPTRCSVFASSDDDAIRNISTFLEEHLSSGRIVAIGECGLDYDRLHFCEKEYQRRGFAAQLQLAEKYNLPMFLHNRNTDGDFLSMVRQYRSCMSRGGVVHSYDGSIEEMKQLVELGLYIGINGCSMKTEENLSMIAEIPVDRLLLETDAPWCGIKNTHASKKHVITEFPATKKKEKFEKGYMVKDRSEPCMIVQVLEVVAAVKGIEPGALAEQVYQNSVLLFFNETA